MWEDYFSVQIFFIILRETLESAIIVSVLLSLVKQTFTAEDPETHEDVLTVDRDTYQRYRSQVWTGAFLGLGLCFAIGAAFILIFYFIGKDLWSVAERVWEGFFSIVSSLIIAVMGLALLRVNTLQSKWRFKLTKSLQREHALSTNDSATSTQQLQGEISDASREINENSEQADSHILGELQGDPVYDDAARFLTWRQKARGFLQKYSLVVLPFITTLREGLEAVVFIGGIGVNQPPSSFPLAIILGAALGIGIGVLMYKGGNEMSLQYFLIISSCFLYLVAAGLMSKGVWFFELESFVQKCGQDTSETGSGPGSYDIGNTLWHVNCCNGLTDGGWMLFNALLGWTNTATYGSVLSYIGFWLFIVFMLRERTYVERHGYSKLLPITWQLKRIRKRIAAEHVVLIEFRDDGGSLVNKPTPAPSAGEAEREALLSPAA